MSQVADVAEELSSAVLRLGRRLRRQTDDGLSAIDMALLATLARHPELGPSDLAEREAISKPSMSIQLKRLAGRGLLARSDDHPADRRRARFQLTPAAQAALARAQRRRASWLIERLVALDAERLAVLERALGVFAELLEPHHLARGHDHDGP